MQIDIESIRAPRCPMDAIPELSRLAEAHGFGCCWAGEANNKDPSIMLAAIAAVTFAHPDRFGDLSHSGTHTATLALPGSRARGNSPEGVLCWVSVLPIRPSQNGTVCPSIIRWAA